MDNKADSDVLRNEKLMGKNGRMSALVSCGLFVFARLTMRGDQ